MNETQKHKKLAILMCVIFATHLVALIFGMFAGTIMYNMGPKVFYIGKIILELPIIISALLIATRKDLILTISAKVATWTFFGFQTFGLINILCYFICDNNIYGIIGQSAHILLPVLYACSAIWFYAALQMWLPLKITAIISAIPPIASGILLYQVAGKDYSDDLMPLINAISTTACISAALYAISLILSIVWIFIKPLAPHAKSNPINII